jgi:hypothetical protein
MTYTMPAHSFDLHESHQTETMESGLLETDVLRAARYIYQTYCEHQIDVTQQPTGVVIHRQTLRGKPVFRDRAILLPAEEFIPLNHIESGMY